MGVQKKTPNDFVYGETGRYPIYISSYVRCIRYWLKLLQMDDRKLPKKAYMMLLGIDSQGKKSWVSGIREFLHKNGFGYVWMNQGVENVSVFPKVLRERLVDNRRQNGDEHMQNSDRYSLYRTFKSSTHCEKYLSLDVDRHIRNHMTRFRFGVTDITVHQYRYKNATELSLLCPLCKKSKEDEQHFFYLFVQFLWIYDINIFQENFMKTLLCSELPCLWQTKMK